MASKKHKLYLTPYINTNPSIAIYVLNGFSGITESFNPLELPD